MRNRRDIADVISAIGSRDFDGAVFDFLSAIMPIDHCTAFIFPDGCAPITLARHSATVAGQYVMSVLATSYAREKYRFDEHIPSLAEFRGVPIMKLIDSTKRTYLDFREERDDYPGTRQELAVFNRTPDAIAYLGIYRGFKKHDFHPAEIDVFERESASVIACLLKHAEVIGGHSMPQTPKATPASMPMEREALERHLISILMKAPGGITYREAEVCANIVLGYRAYSISERLGISAATVASHRKHAYSKLGICSQTELFGRYIGALQQQILPGTLA